MHEKASIEDAKLLLEISHTRREKEPNIAIDNAAESAGVIEQHLTSGDVTTEIVVWTQNDQTGQTLVLASKPSGSKNSVVARILHTRDGDEIVSHEITAPHVTFDTHGLGTTMQIIDGATAEATSFQLSTGKSPFAIGTKRVEYTGRAIEVPAATQVVLPDGSIGIQKDTDMLEVEAGTGMRYASTTRIVREKRVEHELLVSGVSPHHQ